MKYLFSLLALLACSLSCFGQRASVIQLANPTSIATTTAAVTRTNTVLDLHGYEGIALAICSFTNTVSTVGTPTLGFSLLGSSTATGTMAIISSGAVFSSNTFNITNIITGDVGTNAIWTNATTFTAALSNQVTTGGGFTVIGFPIADVPRYINPRFDVNTGTNTYIVSAILIARPTSQ